MNVAIFGDSFANGVSDGMVGLSHSGLTQYLLDDGHFVINFSHQGNTNRGAREDFQHNIRQNPHINFDIAFIFQTETQRDTGEMLWFLEEKNIGIKEVDIHMVELWYSKLQLFQSQTKVPIYLIGGTADTLEPKEVEKFDLKCACQSLINLVLTGEHTIDEPVRNFIFDSPMFRDPDTTRVLDKVLKTTSDKKYFLNMEKQGSDRQQLKLDNPKYFSYVGAPDGLHPNKLTYKILFNHLKESNII
jgi:hypothetical protein